MNPLNLPAAYQPFAKLRIGANQLDNAKALVTIGDIAPLLIGNGTVPHVWLSVPGAQPGDAWRELIVDNVSSSPDLTVKANPGSLSVSLAQVLLINVVRRREGVGVGDDVTVRKLDLRPLGLDIFFVNATDGLHIMGSTMTANALVGVPVAMVMP